MIPAVSRLEPGAQAFLGPKEVSRPSWRKGPALALTLPGWHTEGRLPLCPSRQNLAGQGLFVP